MFSPACGLTPYDEDEMRVSGFAFSHFVPSTVGMIALAVVLLGACNDIQPTADYAGAGYWRPISSPNILLATDDAQMKLEFDLRQCNCANFPTNFPTPAYIAFQPDLGQLAQTSIIGVGPQGTCQNVPAEVLRECMRARGWEPTLCAGRLPATPDGTGGGC